MIWLKSHWVSVKYSSSSFFMLQNRSEFPQSRIETWELWAKIHFHTEFPVDCKVEKYVTTINLLLLIIFYSKNAFILSNATKCPVSMQNLINSNVSIRLLHEIWKKAMISHKPMKNVQLWNQWRGKWVAKIFFGQIISSIVRWLCLKATQFINNMPQMVSMQLVNII